MDSSLCTQPPEISSDAQDVFNNGDVAVKKKKRKSKLKINRQDTYDVNVTHDQVAAALAASRARVASQTSGDAAVTAATSSEKQHTHECAPKTTHSAAVDVNVVDLTESPKTSNAQKKPPTTKKTPKMNAPAAAADAITITPTLTPHSNPSTSSRCSSDVDVNNNKNSLPHAPTLTIPSNNREGEGNAKAPTKHLKARDEVAAPRVSLDPVAMVAAKESKAAKKRPSVDSATTSSKNAKVARVSLEPTTQTCKAKTSKAKLVEDLEEVKASSDKLPAASSKAKKQKEEPKSTAAAQTQAAKTNSASSAPSQTASKNNKKDSTKSTAAVQPTKSPPPQQPLKTPHPTTTKKKRSFHDQILYTMLTTSRPYSLKTLAKACDTTTAALNHAMLSFLDKQLVICKEFPSKKGEPKKLYWANPISNSELGNKTAVSKEFSKLLASPEEMASAQKMQQELMLKLRQVNDELRPILAIPTLNQIDQEITKEEKELQSIRSEISAIQKRIEEASKPKPTKSYSRFKQPPKPRDKTSLKRGINHHILEYKKRKRTCMDFVENLSDAMERPVKDVTKVLDLETDETEWVCWKDEGTGKIYGKVRGKGVVGEEDVKVRIPAKYDV